MLVDMHLHEKIFSLDSFITVEQMVEVAKARGLDAICITDHDSMGFRDLVAEYAERLQFPIFVGIEYYSLWGDILAWGIDKYPDYRGDAQMFIDLVNEQGGFCVSCHPFRNNNRGLEDNLRRVKGLHGVEVLNGSTDMEANRTALRYARELGLKTTGGSDAHVVKQIGKYVTWLPEKVVTLEDFVQQFHTCAPKPVLWNGSSYEVLEDF